MLNHHALLEAHVEALFTMTPAGRLDRVNEPPGKPGPRFFRGKTPDGAERWFRHDVSEHTIRELDAACEGLSPAMDIDGPAPEVAVFEAILNRIAAVSSKESGPAFYVSEPAIGTDAVHVTTANATLVEPYLGAWRVCVTAGQPLWAVVVAGQAVSVCGSVRQTAVAHEAGVETVPQFRGRGYAGQAVRAWAAAVQRLNRVPLYSTGWENTASRAVARRLGLVQFASDVHIT